jgi:SynChlorMet cassette radical SAM/SPASM protein ScmE
MLDAQSRERAMAALERVSARYPGRIQAAAGPLAELRMWRDMRARAAAREPQSPSGGHLTGCGCTKNTLAVRADGSYVPCCMLPALVLGRINHDELIEVWQRSPILAAMRARSQVALAGFAFCQGCGFLDYCTGNCPALAYRLVGQVDHPSPDACLRRFLECGGRVPEAPGPPAIGHV